MTLYVEEQAHDLVAIGAQNQRMGNLLGLGIGSHIGSQKLFLEGNSNVNIAVYSLYRRGFIGFPERFVDLQIGIEIQKIEKMIIRLFHSI